MTTFYEFQEQFPNDDACLEHIMNTRFGGTRIGLPEVWQTQQVSQDEAPAQLCVPVLRTPYLSMRGYDHGTIPHTASQVVLCHVLVLHFPSWRGRHGTQASTRSDVQVRLADGS